MKYFDTENYDRADKYSIEEYGQKMVGKTFQNLIDMDTDNTFVVREPEISYDVAHENKKRKGGLGEIVEERFFHYKANNDSAPDFKEAGVELKTTPYKINKNKTLSAKERLVLNMIDYNSVVNETVFNDSHFWYKNQWILLVYYLWLAEQKRLDYRIDYVRLFTPSNQDLNIIKKDYQKIIQKIQEGKAHELSESDTMYLSACTKSSDSSVTRSQPYSDIPAKPRAFAYKSSYMTYVLNNYIVGSKPAFESILQNEEVDDIESYVVNQIAMYRGKTQEELCQILGIDIKEKTPKNLESMIAFRMLNVKGNNAEEFVKANVIVKTIRINKNGKIKEHMSFPTFKFNEVVNQKWEESDFYNYLSTTKFLFIVYQENENGEYELDHSQFWNMPYEDLENEVKVVWLKTKDTLNHLPDAIYDGTHYISIFPTQSENRVSHVRPHGQNSKDTYKLPDGRDYPKQCFWLNNSYILSIVKNEKS